MFSLSRALEILSQYLVLRTDILKKTVVECTCFNGKTPYCQNSIINVLKATVSLALHHKPPSQNKFKPSSEFISFCIFKSVCMYTFVAIKSLDRVEQAQLAIEQSSDDDFVILLPFLGKGGIH